MDWSEWHHRYDAAPALAARLRIVREQITATLDQCAAGPIRIVSLCAGDGRDVIGSLQGHPRRGDVTAWLLDTHGDSLARGARMGEAAGVEDALRFVQRDATHAASYQGMVPADLILLSGFLGHVKPASVRDLVSSLPMLCKSGGFVIWNKHLTANDGAAQVPVIRDLLLRAGFDEVHYEVTGHDGYATGRARFRGEPAPLDTARVLFEFAT